MPATYDRDGPAGRRPRRERLRHPSARAYDRDGPGGTTAAPGASASPVRPRHRIDAGRLRSHTDPEAPQVSADRPKLALSLPAVRPRQARRDDGRSGSVCLTRPPARRPRARARPRVVAAPARFSSTSRAAARAAPAAMSAPASASPQPGLPAARQLPRQHQPPRAATPRSRAALPRPPTARRAAPPPAAVVRRQARRQHRRVGRQVGLRQRSASARSARRPRASSSSPANRAAISVSAAPARTPRRPRRRRRARACAPRPPRGTSRGSRPAGCVRAPHDRPRNDGRFAHCPCNWID